MKSTPVTKLDFTIHLAEEQARQGNAKGALDIYLDLLKQRLIGEGSSVIDVATWTDVDMYIIERTVSLAGLLGHTDAADYLLQGMVDRCQQRGVRYQTDLVLLKRAYLMLSCGNLRKAMTLLNALQPSIGDINQISFEPTGLLQWEQSCYWLQLDDQIRSMLFTRFYLVLGWLVASQGQYHSARHILQRGLLYTKRENPASAAKVLLTLHLTLAQVLLEMGEMKAAQAKLDELAFSRAILGDLSGYIQWLELSGRLDWFQGKLGRAVEYFTEVWHLCHLHQLPQATVTATLNLAQLFISLNQSQLARQLLQTAKQQVNTQDIQTQLERITYLLYAAELRRQWLTTGVLGISSVFDMLHLVLAEKNPVDSSVLGTPSVVDMLHPTPPTQEPRPTPHTPTLSNSEQSSDYLTFFEDRLQEFYLQINREINETGHVSEADYGLKQLWETFGHSDSDLIHLRLDIADGILAFFMDQFERAEAQLLKVCPTLQQQQLFPELWQVHRFLIRCREILGRSHDEIEPLIYANNDLLQALMTSLPTTDQASFLLSKLTEREKFIAHEVSKLTTLHQVLHQGPWPTRLWRYWTIMRRLNKLLHEVDQQKSTLAKQVIRQQTPEVSNVSPPPALWRWLWQQPYRQATLTFLVLPNHVLIITTGWCFFNVTSIALPVQTLRQLVREWYAKIDEVSPSSRTLIPKDRKAQSPQPVTNEADEVAATLAKALQIPDIIAALPERIRCLNIVPDDILHGFPFAVLRYEEKYLIERYRLAVAFQSSHCRSFNRLPNPATFLEIGVSNHNSQYHSLPGVLQELTANYRWREHLKSQKRDWNFCSLENATATKQAVSEKLRSASLLHIACHGVFRPDRPDKAGLVLIPESGSPEEVLTLRELLAMQLEGLAHATLSSCWSADKIILPGRWVVGLPEALWRTGVQSILASLWQVNDQTAIAFMTTFYKYLSKYPRDEALQRTQLKFLSGKLQVQGIDTSNPFHWAGYTLYGDSSFLRL